MYKIVLEEGQEADQRRLLNWRILRRDWRNFFPARQVRALWEDQFPELRRALMDPFQHELARIVLEVVAGRGFVPGAAMRFSSMAWPHAHPTTSTYSAPNAAGRSKSMPTSWQRSVGIDST
jgi:hypothetical protein